MSEKLVVYTVTDNFFSSVKDFFGETAKVEVLPKNWEKMKGFSSDLIVFTGGEDIGEQFYKPVENPGPVNKRDTWELYVFKALTAGKLSTKRVVGICRGLQLINVGFGGTLVEDIWTKYKEGHKAIHEITHQRRNAFQNIPIVNSLHHQGIERAGTHSKFPMVILAREPRTGIAEIAIWGNFILGFQFHPEFLSDVNPHKKVILDVIVDWVKDKINLLGEPARTQEKPKKEIYTEVYDHDPEFLGIENSNPQGAIESTARRTMEVAAEERARRITEERARRTGRHVGFTATFNPSANMFSNNIVSSDINEQEERMSRFIATDNTESEDE